MKRILCILLVLLLFLSLAVPATATEPQIPSDAPTPVTTEPEEPDDPVPTEPEDPQDPTPTEPEEPLPTEPEDREDEYHKPIVSGMTDGSFRPGADLSRAEVAAILCTLRDYPDGPPRFNDVPEKAWYARPVNALAAAGVVAGYSDGGFHPGAPITRAELAALLAVLYGQPYSVPCSFRDVPPNSWCYAAISLAQEKDWVSGYSDGSFRPNQSVTRAEAMVMLTKFLDRHADMEAIDRGEGLHYFPDVQPGSWYYYYVMEAATGHTAHFETPESTETWASPDGSSFPVPDGFYCFGTSLFAVENGAYVRSAGDGSLEGVSYTCTGSSGVCTAKTEVLTLASGELILLSKGRPLAEPGRYTDGLRLKAGHLYAARDGYLLHSKLSGTASGVSYHCTGASGRCQVDDWTKLSLPGVSLSVFNSGLTADASSQGSGTVSLGQLLRASVRVYERYFRVEYPVAGNDLQGYVDKALEYGILPDAASGWDSAATTADAAICLVNALHGRELEQINEIDSVPELAQSSACYRSALTLYRAGVMTGLGEEHSFDPDAPLSAKELGEILTRLEQRGKRIRFSMKTVKTLQYGTSGSGRYPLTAYQIGNGKNVMVLSFAIHGWEDNWSRDGQELVYLADQTRDYLERHYELVRNGDWTVYIMRCLNPDGLYLGSTHNGPGRCTTTRYNASGKLVSDKGIDMNRCFPYKFQVRTDPRNFNGTAPLQCREAQAIAAFIQKVKGNGFNICIDTHGWLGQIITTSGKGTIYRAFAAQFPKNVYTYMGGGSGYMTGWTGFILGYDSCLLELPKGITSHSAFLNAGCVWRYENAIAQLLAHYNGPNATRNPRDYVEVELDGN